MGKRYEEKIYKYNSETSSKSDDMGCNVCVWYFLPPKTIINGNRYFNLLRNKLKFNLQAHRYFILMHDGAPCYRSKDASKFLKFKQIQMIHWRSNTLDLTPTENLWSNLKNKVSEKVNIQYYGTCSSHKECLVYKDFSSLLPISNLQYVEQDCSSDEKRKKVYKILRLILILH